MWAGYGGGTVLRGVDLAVRPGEILAVLGPNGAGKSTACRVAAGALAAADGRILVHGRDVTRDGPVRRARSGVLLAPEARGIFPSLGIEENLALYLEDPAERDAVYARFPRLRERRGVAAGALSGGEQQMLALAPLLQRPPRVLIADEPSLALAPRVTEEVYALLTELRDAGTALLLVEEKARAVADPPRVLLLDEPASGLSAPEREQLAAVVRRLAAEEGCAVLLVEHDVAFVMDLCTRVVVLDLGTVLAEGSPAAIRADPLVREAYLGVS